MSTYVERLLLTVGALYVSVLLLEETWHRLHPLLPFLFGLFVMAFVITILVKVVLHKRRNW